MPSLHHLQLLFLLSLLPFALGTATPEPQVDPLMPMPPTAPPRYVRLSIEPAGLAGKRVGKSMRLSASRTNFVCPGDYPTGFSVKCAVRPKPSRVIFRVNGEFARVERAIPYFLAGDWKGNVRPWMPKERRVTVECRPADRKRISAEIVIKC